MKRYFIGSLKIAQDLKRQSVIVYNTRRDRENHFTFCAKKNDDESGNTFAYLFLGAANYLDHYGSKPTNIHWKLEEQILHYMRKETAKMAVG
ncbi:hypothetical protein L0657_12555 [Dyadobacter sp. CY345]|uniref:hypothetical protein n=1 Tax=Dyadobacter sp. CY345 TaxID=2909335 RepID=UPI001F36EC2A|nr:hypothetical protein [Dyadobacter sp. CY345]MCF2444791.1 hypothetical protein [Dyadobacter sp. CY345]